MVAGLLSWPQVNNKQKKRRNIHSFFSSGSLRIKN
jgi:hypothetical protein